MLGHIQRGGEPSPFDRILATRFGAEACGLIAKGEFGKMVVLKAGRINKVNLKKAAEDIKRVSLNDPVIKTARLVGTSFGV